MERNNKFMFAYILFIVFCGFARLFVEYSAWEEIVAAVTCSSWFFAVSDSYRADIEDIQEYINITSNYSTSCLKSIKIIIEGIQNSISQAKADVNVNRDNVDYVSKGEDIIQTLEEIIPYFQDKEKESKDKQSKIKRKEIGETIFTIGGYFTFFVILTFNTIAEIAIAVQDVLTVFAFASILVTQFFTTLNRKVNAKKQDEFNEMIRKFEKLSDRYTNCCNRSMGE